MPSSKTFRYIVGKIKVPIPTIELLAWSEKGVLYSLTSSGGVGRRMGSSATGVRARWGETMWISVKAFGVPTIPVAGAHTEVYSLLSIYSETWEITVNMFVGPWVQRALASGITWGADVTVKGDLRWIIADTRLHDYYANLWNQCKLDFCCIEKNLIRFDVPIKTIL